MNITRTPLAPREMATLSAVQIRQALELSSIDVRATAWDGFFSENPQDQIVLISGHRIQPHPEPGVLRVDGFEWFSAEWR